MTGGLPLEGLRVLEYGQYVAAPLAAMLLADLGADVVKVEPPRGDEWRRYDPFAPGESRFFYALNRNKRSVAVDLRTETGRADSRALIAGADALVHNHPPERARRFGLDRDAVAALNGDCVVVCVSAFGRAGPLAGRPGYDLIGQSLSGLLLAGEADAGPRPAGAVPRRPGGLALADITAGILAALAVVAGLHARARGTGAPELEVSLLGAALTVQIQRFVAVGGVDDGPGGPPAPPPEELDPYYRVHRCRDGFVAVACLNVAQRESVCALAGRRDPHVGNPQAPPRTDAEHAARLAHVRAVEAALETLTAGEAVAALRTRGVPAAPLRRLPELFADEQARANGLVQKLDQPGVGPVSLLGGVVAVDGVAPRARRPAPALDEHRAELLGGPRQPSAGSTWART